MPAERPLDGPEALAALLAAGEIDTAPRLAERLVCPGVGADSARHPAFGGAGAEPAVEVGVEAR